MAGRGRRGLLGRRSVEIFDPTAGAFQPVAFMGTRRASHGAVPLRDGRILVVGGWTGGQATATRLPIGEVLILGGYDDRTRSSASTWLVRTTDRSDRSREHEKPAGGAARR